MCVCIFIARIYEENGHSGHQKTKPIQTQLKPIQTQFKANLTQNKPNSNPIKANFEPIPGHKDRREGGREKRRGRLRREFKMRSKPHPSTIAGLIVPASGAWMLTSFNVPAGNGTMVGFMPDRNMPDGHMPGRCSYDYFASRVAAVVLSDKGAAGNRDC